MRSVSSLHQLQCLPASSHRFLARNALIRPMSEPQVAKNSYDGDRRTAKYQTRGRATDAPPPHQDNRRNNSYRRGYGIRD